MKRLLAGLVAGLLLIGALASPVVAQAQKTTLVRAGATPGAPIGFVVFNSPSGTSKAGNLIVNVQLFDATASTDLDIYLYIAATSGGTKLGTVRTDAFGDASFHARLDHPVASGTSGIHWLAVDITRHSQGLDLYVTPGLYGATKLYVDLK